MPEVSSWRDLLRIMISSAKERERLANEVGVSSVTISRWVTGNFEPRPQSLQRLIQVVPGEYREEFHALVAREYPHLAHPASFYEPPELSGEFFRRAPDPGIRAGGRRDPSPRSGDPRTRAPAARRVARRNVSGRHHGLDVAAHVEVPDHLAVPR